VNEIFRGRYTAHIEGPFVVFVIGMRVNRLLAPHKWVPVMRAMGPMIRELAGREDLGLLHAESFLYWRGAALIQYWRSFEQLEAFARNPSLSHLDAWKRFNRAIGSDGSVGIWHETFSVAAGQYESIYANMPRRGLAHAGTHEAVASATETAKRRRGQQGEPAVPSEQTPPR
jgi:hypothetical protein